MCFTNDLRVWLAHGVSWCNFSGIWSSSPNIPDPSPAPRGRKGRAARQRRPPWGCLGHLREGESSKTVVQCPPPHPNGCDFTLLWSAEAAKPLWILATAAARRDLTLTKLLRKSKKCCFWFPLEPRRWNRNYIATPAKGWWRWRVGEERIWPTRPRGKQRHALLESRKGLWWRGSVMGLGGGCSRCPVR